MSQQRGTDTPSLERPEFVVQKERLYRRLLAACAVLTVAVTLGTGGKQASIQSLLLDDELGAFERRRVGTALLTHLAYVTGR